MEDAVRSVKVHEGPEGPGKSGKIPEVREGREGPERSGKVQGGPGRSGKVPRVWEGRGKSKEVQEGPGRFRRFGSWFTRDVKKPKIILQKPFPNY